MKILLHTQTHIHTYILHTHKHISTLDTYKCEGIYKRTNAGTRQGRPLARTLKRATHIITQTNHVHRSTQTHAHIRQDTADKTKELEALKEEREATLVKLFELEKAYEVMCTYRCTRTDTCRCCSLHVYVIYAYIHIKIHIHAHLPPGICMRVCTNMDTFLCAEQEEKRDT